MDNCISIRLSRNFIRRSEIDINSVFTPKMFVGEQVITRTNDGIVPRCIFTSSDFNRLNDIGGRFCSDPRWKHPVNVRYVLNTWRT